MLVSLRLVRDLSAGRRHGGDMHGSGFTGLSIPPAQQSRDVLSAHGGHHCHSVDRGPTIFASVASVMAFAFFFVPHYNSFRVANTEFFITLVGMLLVTTLISKLTMRVRHQAKVARQQEWQTTALYEMNQTLAGKSDLAELLQAAVTQISSLFDSRVSILLPDDQKKLRVRAGAFLSPEDIREALVANWVFKHGHLAGAGTQTLPEVKWIYFPLITSNHQVLGVLRLEGRSSKNVFEVEYLRLIEALSSQIAAAIEREDLSRQTRLAQLQVETRNDSGIPSSVPYPMTADPADGDRRFRQQPVGGGRESGPTNQTGPGA